MRNKYGMFLFICLILAALLGTCSKVEAKPTLTVATGVMLATDGYLIEVGIDHSLATYLLANASVGHFNDTSYVDAGLSLSYWRVTVGCSIAYLDNVPRMLSMHSQLKPSLSIQLLDDLSLRYIHFSNGSRKHPNYGQDFLGIKFDW